MNDTIQAIQDKLAEKFPADEIEWRIGSAYDGSATVLAYITARGIMSRLDSVFGIMGWRDQYEIMDKGVLCRLSVCVDGEWITKEDVAPYSNVEAFKGGVSDALKRAGVKFGIGRYLYDLGQNYVTLIAEKPSKKGWRTHKDKQSKTWYWFEPKLPSWALPGASEDEAAATALAQVKEETVGYLKAMLDKKVFYPSKDRIAGDVYSYLRVPMSDSISVMVGECDNATYLADFHTYLHQVLDTTIRDVMASLSQDAQSEYHNTEHQKRSYNAHLGAAKPEDCSDLGKKIEYCAYLSDKMPKAPKAKTTKATKAQANLVMPDSASEPEAGEA